MKRLVREAGANAEQAMDWRYNPKGLLLAGSTGKCKTRVLWMLLKRLHVEDGYSFKVVDWHVMQRAIMDNKLFSTWEREFFNADVVAIDDLGKVRFSDRLESELFSLIEE